MGCNVLRFRAIVAFSTIVMAILGSATAWADGMVFPPAKYHGSLEERGQEAIIIFNSSPPQREATEDLILKIHVEGDTSQFAWIVPFPTQPTVKKADAKLFKELYDYVTYRSKPPKTAKSSKFAGAGGMGGGMGVEVLSREIVGSYDVAEVREKERGALNKWLAAEGYRTIVDGDDDVIEYYRKKNYVFSCIKVSEADLKTSKPVDLHPLRFTFKTGGHDGIYFPMKLTGLQKESFDVTLYVFYQWWLNDNLNQYGYEHRGFHRRYRDWDGPQCTPNAGKNWAKPQTDPFLRDAAQRIKTVAEFFQAHHPKDRYYLTNIQARGLKPDEVRKWPDDLWLFPYYLDKTRVPQDAQAGGLAEGAYAK